MRKGHLGLNEATVQSMYSIMSELNNRGVPIIFKGAMVLKAMQMQYGNPSGLTRDTRDIDGDFMVDIDTPKNAVEILRNEIQSVVNDLGYPLIVKIARENGKFQSAGFEFWDTTLGDVSFTADINFKDTRTGYTPFSIFYYGNFRFCGQVIEKSIADKITVVSKRTVCRRIKDMIDLYIIFNMWNGNLIDVVSTFNVDLGDFSFFKNNIAELKHAYSRYTNSASVLPFEVVYQYVYNKLQILMR